MFAIKNLRNTLTAFAALTLTAVLPNLGRADILGIHAPGMTQQQPQPHAVPQQQILIKNKMVVSVTTFVRDRAGNTRSVTWDFTTHLWNPQTRQWIPQNWGASYIRAIQGLNQQGWAAYDARNSNFRLVTGTW